MTERVRDWVIGGTFAVSVLAGGAAIASNQTALEVARQQAADRKDRQVQRKAMLQVLQALDPEHASRYDDILKGQGR